MLRKWLVFSNFVVIMVVGGYFAYFISTLIPIPGSKFITLGPFLTFVIMIPLERYPKFGTISIINIVFGLIMFMMSPWMTVAIIMSGILADLIMLSPINGWRKNVIALGVYNGLSFIISFWITNFVTGNLLYNVMGMKPLIVACILSFFTGAAGAYLGRRVSLRYLGHIKE